MKKVVLIMALALFSFGVYSKPTSYGVDVFTVAQFKEGLGKLTKIENIEITTYANKESVNAAFPGKNKERWLNKTAARECPKMVIMYIWELYTGGRSSNYSFNLCADVNESVVKYRYDLEAVTYTCYANKTEVLNSLFPNIQSDSDVVAEVTSKKK